MKDSVYGKGIVLMIIAVFIGAFIETSVSTENIGRGEIIRDFVSTEIDGVGEGIATTFSNIAVAERLPRSKLEKASMTHILGNNMYDGSNFPVFSMDVDCQNPAIVYDKANEILVLSEVLETSGETWLLGRWSDNGGGDWVSENEVTGWCFYDDVKRPKIDYYGEDSSAWGTVTPGQDDTGMAYYLEFPDIADPNVGYGWELWYVDWEYYLGYTNFDSADVACYSDELNIPSSDFFGVIALTGDSPQNPPDEFESNTIAITFFDDWDVKIFHFTNITEDCKKVTVEIDQTNGRLYVVCEYENNSQLDDGTLILYHDISSDEEWYSGEWPGYYFENLFNPSVAVDNGAVCIVGEMKSNGQKDIVCYYSLDAGQNFLESLVTDTPDDDEIFPSVTSGSVIIPTVGRNNESIICSYIRDGDIYISDSGGHGESWWEFPLKVSDESGIPVEQYCSLSMDDVYLAWTDARNNPTEIYFDEYAYPEYSWPEIGINHGFCLNITADVCSPRTPAYYVDWTIRIDGGILFTEREISDFIEKISAGAQEGVGTGWVFGFGKILITVEIDQWYGDSVTENAYGFIFGPFVYVF